MTNEFNDEGMFYKNRFISSSGININLSMIDQCPICKTSRYLNPNLKFLVNPECYHKICANCVDRLFSMGPAPCPYENCGKMLRKNKFKQQVFEDLGVEREVDVRQRVSKTFNKRAEDFPTLREYNNYLEEVEEIIFNLVNNIDVEATQEKLQTYEQKNRDLILANSRRQKFDDEQQELRARYDKERKIKLIQLEVEMSKAEKEIKEEAQKEYLEELSLSTSNPELLKTKMNKKISSLIAARRSALEAQLLLPPPPVAQSLRGFIEENSRNRDGYGSRGSSIGPGAVPSTPFTPFNGDYEKEPLYERKEKYIEPILDKIVEDPKCIGSGYRLDKAYQLDLSQGFFGLGCMISKEKTPTTA